MTMRSFRKTGLGPSPDQPRPPKVVRSSGWRRQDWQGWSFLQDLTSRTIRKPGELPCTFKPTSIHLQLYKTNGCPAGQNIVNQISNTKCTQITNTGITTVVVVPKPDMPSNCVLTLYADTNCFSTSNASIGPITPSPNPSVCIRPIGNSAGDLFEVKSAVLIGWI